MKQNFIQVNIFDLNRILARKADFWANDHCPAVMMSGNKQSY